MNQDVHATTGEVSCFGAVPTTLAQLSGGVGSSTVASANFPGDPGGLGGSLGGAPDALGALVGTPGQGGDNVATLNSAGTGYVGSFTAALNGGDLVVINNFCNQVVDIRTSGVTLSGPSGDIAVGSGPPEFQINNGISNQVIVDGAQRVTINDITVGSGNTVVTFSSGYGFAGFGVLTVVHSAQVTVENALVAFSPTRGIYVSDNSGVHLLSSSVTDNGVGNTDQADNTGIYADGASSVTLGTVVAAGTSSGADPASVTSNGGDGIRVRNTSSLGIAAGTVSGNGQKQLFAVTSSAILLSGNNAFAANGNAPLVAISAPSNSDTVISIEAGSSLLIEGQASVTSGSTGTTIAAYGSGTVLLEGSFISGGSTTLQITGGSLLALAGGNYICNGTQATSTLTPGCTAFTGDTNSAIEVDHVGALYQVGAISGFGFTAAADTITGGGVLELQSTADLGAGLIGGATPSLLWTTGANGISVAQNSSLRLQGGVDITGSIAVAQGSNGFVNLSQTPGHTLTNTVSAGISCPFKTVPASHLQLGNNSLNPSTPATVLATSFTGATSPQCLPF
jgi:hypothetical protein